MARRTPRTWLRRLLGTLLALVLTAGAAVGWVAYQHSYELREQRVTITGGAQPLDGVLARPEGGDGPFGLVVFVHGDGPADATRDSFYRPIWESLARAGFASLSWNKPGVGGAPGDWLDQSMDDRAAETAAAIAWARSQPGVDPDRIGLWGISQAGWVLPKVANRVPEVRFVIAVSPAVDWLRQGRYNLLAELADEHAPRSRIDAELARRERVNDQLRKGATYEQARAAVGADLGDLTPGRWRFIGRNFTADATADLAALKVPVLLVLGGRDRNVDVADTESGYRRLLTGPGQLTVRSYPGASHGLAAPGVEDDSLRGLLTAVAAPRSVYVDGYLDDLRRYLESVAPKGAHR
ncbi:alpha/beta hydrolase family protein [Kitasatospora sp. NPDC048239]|uniref:alpha/beta hydrolase family protein n=1 Tax=Kitasatospora sp. NPDC048239 TaxID=3364046 RepID=UPI00371E34FB